MSKSVQIVLVVIILTAGIVGLTYYYKDKPVEVINLASESDEFRLTKDQYDRLYYGVFADDGQGQVINKADYIFFQVILQLQERVKALETTVGLYEPAVDLSFEEPVE